MSQKKQSFSFTWFMQRSRVDKLPRASKSEDRIYELRNLELVGGARVSDQHKYYCPEKKEKKLL